MRHLVLLLMGLLGCGDAMDDGAVGGGGEGAGGEAGGGGDPGSDPRAEDYAALEACSVPTCAEARASRNDSPIPISLDGFECVLEAMVSRTPGTYRVRLDHQWGNGAAFYDQVVVVTAAGDALYATESSYNVNGSIDPAWQPFTPVRRCNLKAVSFFEECLANYADGSAAGSGWVDCIYPDDGAWQETVALPWFESCQETEPVCQ